MERDRCVRWGFKSPLLPDIEYCRWPVFELLSVGDLVKRFGDEDDENSAYQYCESGVADIQDLQNEEQRKCPTDSTAERMLKLSGF